MKNYRVLDIFQTLQMLPKFKSSFLPNLPSSILRRQHHHSSQGASLRPAPPPSRQAEGGLCRLSLCRVSALLSLWPHRSRFSPFLVLDYYSWAPNWSQNIFHITVKINFLENRLWQVVPLFDQLLCAFPSRRMVLSHGMCQECWSSLPASSAISSAIPYIVTAVNSLRSPTHTKLPHHYLNSPLSMQTEHIINRRSTDKSLWYLSTAIVFKVYV